ncbi:MAG TPA: hypothetical protein VFC56_05065 [Stellaceae bacterium]|nr:hypothetical protein [Stellaceae bacterium]
MHSQTAQSIPIAGDWSRLHALSLKAERPPGLSAAEGLEKGVLEQEFKKALVATHKSLRLDPETWDLTVDSSGNIAVATGEEAISQDEECERRSYSDFLQQARDWVDQLWSERFGTIASDNNPSRKVSKKDTLRAILEYEKESKDLGQELNIKRAWAYIKKRYGNKVSSTHFRTLYKEQYPARRRGRPPKNPGK